MTKRLEAFADTDGIFLAAKSTTIMVPKSQLDVEYLAALMNSQLMNFVMNRKFGGLALSGGYLRVGPPQLKQLPVKVPDSSSPRDAELASHILALARRLAKLRSDLSKARVPATVERIRRELIVAERKLDTAVFEIYGVTKEEVSRLGA
jgi:hypothetical protein